MMSNTTKTNHRNSQVTQDSATSEEPVEQQNEDTSENPKTASSQETVSNTPADDQSQAGSMLEAAGSITNSAVQIVENNGHHNPLYLGLAIAFAVASLGVAFSTFPVFLSIPLAGVLLGISVWLLCHVGVIHLTTSDSTDQQQLVSTSTIGVLIAAQIAITDIFLFTRLGSVGSKQSGMVIAWILATAVEAAAAAAVIVASLRRKP